MSARWTVLVCGDPARGDDGAPAAVADRLGDLPAGVEVRRVGQLGADDLLAALAGGRCLVVDTVRGIPPGTIVRLPLDGLGTVRASTASTHASPLPAAVELAAALGAPVARGCFVGVGGVDFALGAPLSPAVRRALGRVAAAIRATVVEVPARCA